MTDSEKIERHKRMSPRVYFGVFIGIACFTAALIQNLTSGAPFDWSSGTYSIAGILVALGGGFYWTATKNTGK